MKQLILTLTFLILGNIAISQSGWSSGNVYAYQGETITQTSYQQMYDPYCLCYRNALACRQLTWHQEYYEGNVYYWNGNNWAYQYQSGYFWYCTWTAWYWC